MSADDAHSAGGTKHGVGQLLIELGPILAFVVAFNVLNRWRPDDAIYIATGIFMAAILAAVAYSWFRTSRIPPVLLVTGVLVVVFGGLTLLLRNETFLKIKPTVVYLFYASAIFGSLLMRQNIWKLLFRHAFTLPERIWNVLAVRWGLFFLFMAGVNEAIRHTQSTEFWVNSRVLIVYPLIFAFLLLNLPITMKHMGKTDDSPAPSNPPHTEA